MLSLELCMRDTTIIQEINYAILFSLTRDQILIVEKSPVKDTGRHSIYT